MNEQVYKLNCYLIILANNITSDKLYVYSLSESKIALPYISIEDKNKHDIEKYINSYVHSIMHISDIDIFINLISLHSSEVAESVACSKDTLCPIFGVEVPDNINLLSGHWKEFSILDYNDGINYPISLAMQRCIL